MELSYIIVSSVSNSDESLDSYNDEEYDCDADQECTSSSVASSDCSSVGDTEDPTRVVYYKPCMHVNSNRQISCSQGAFFFSTNIGQ